MVLRIIIDFILHLTNNFFELLNVVLQNKKALLNHPEILNFLSVFVDIRDNPIICDCYPKNFTSFLERKVFLKIIKIIVFNINSLTC